MRALTPSVLLLSALALGAVAPAHAQYKCRQGDKVVYQQAPCPEGQKVNTSGAGNADLDSSYAAQARADVAQQARRDQADAAVGSGSVFVGMAKADLLRAWGQPAAVQRLATAAGVQEQWLYRNRQRGDQQTVMLEGGVVVAVQTAETLAPRAFESRRAEKTDAAARPRVNAASAAPAGEAPRSRMSALE